MLYTALNHFETWPHQSRFGDCLRSGRGSLAVQLPRAALDSNRKWPGLLPDIFTGPWVELGRWMICRGMDLFLDLHWWKRDDPTKVRSVALSREQMENLGCIWLFSMLPQNFLGSPISLPFWSSLGEGTRGCHLVTIADISYISLERTKNCPLVWFQQHLHKLIMIIYNEHNECNLRRAPKTRCLVNSWNFKIRKLCLPWDHNFIFPVYLLCLEISLFVLKISG